MQQRPILNYQPTYMITSKTGHRLVNVTINDFMFPDEFVNVIVGVLRKRGKEILTIEDMVTQFGKLSDDDLISIHQVGILDITVDDNDRLPEGKPCAMVWSNLENVDDIAKSTTQ